jgi:hypothetical protein
LTILLAYSLIPAGKRLTTWRARHFLAITFGKGLFYVCGLAAKVNSSW